ncbi:MAG TPA: carboxypeptidase-like regulatory domain-containing protein [Pirellulales bacterium]|nr:carboxypeptidase-like regulatory domain-containing protein [Pirellulales bacterium]
MRLRIRCGLWTLSVVFVLATSAVALGDGPAATTETDQAATSAQTKQSALESLSGVVVDEGGKPIQGAKVAYTWWRNGQNEEIDTTSDNQGRFTLPPSPMFADRGAWPPGVLWAGATGYRLRYQRLFEEGKPANGDQLRLVLPAPADVSITVRGPDGKPLPGAQVSATTVSVAAEALAGIDLPAALALIKDLKDDGEYDRHHGNIARILARSNPAESVRVLRMVRDQFQRDQHAQRVAYFVAPADAARATEAIGLIADPEVKAAAEVLSAIALSNAVVERNSFRSPAAASKPKVKKANGMNSVLQLERAYEALAHLSSSDARHAWGYHAAPVWAAWLLPAVETLEPDRLEEYLWRAISLRVPLLKQGQREQTAVLTRAYLAMFIARYDRQLARELYGDLIPEASARLDEQEFAGAAKGLFAAAAVIDAPWCAEQYEKLPDRAKIAARGGIVEILSQSGEARWRAESELLRMWMPWNTIE